MTNKQSWEEDTRRIITGQYPDLFDIPKNGQSVWLEKEYMNGLLDLIEKIISSLLTRQAQEIEERINSIKVEGNKVGNFELGDKVLEFANELMDEFKSKTLLAIKQVINK